MKYFKKYNVATILITLLCLCLIFSGIQAIVLYQYFNAWNLVITDALISNLVLFISAATIVGIAQNIFFGKLKNGMLLPKNCGFIVPFFVYEMFLKAMLNGAFKNSTDYLSFIHQSLLIRYFLGWLFLAALLLITWLWMFFLEQQDKINLNTDAERLLREAELTKLRQQLQPHFLFNSLNSINALVGVNPAAARKMIQQLSDFLRGTLKKDDNNFQSLAEELNYLNLYLEIEKVRFGNRLNTIIEAPENILQQKLPALLLQPIVENAIKFGLYDTIDVVTISIKCAPENNFLKIEITNPYDSTTAKPKQGEGFGLSSVQRRLYLLFGRNDLLAVNYEVNIFTTTLKIPQ